MSFCVKCGFQYDEINEHNFCARCGFDLRKTATTPLPSSLSIPNAASPTLIGAPSPIASLKPDDKKPIVGIIVTLVLCVGGLIWSGAVLFHSFFGSPNNAQVLIYQLFPLLQINAYIGGSFALLGNTTLIIGALLAYQNHPNGSKVVKVTSYSMIGLTLLLVLISCFAVFGVNAWATLDLPTKGAMIGGLIGGTIGAIIQYGLIIFLFRNLKSDSKYKFPKHLEKTKPWMPRRNLLFSFFFLLIAFISFIFCILALFSDELSTMRKIFGPMLSGLVAIYSFKLARKFVVGRDEDNDLSR